jgi:hypothetical protein
MTSYCIHCGEPQAVSEPHVCPSCAERTPPFRLEAATYGKLWSDLMRAALDRIGLPAITWLNMKLSGSMVAASYDPSPPGKLVLNLTYADELICMMLVHELIHAIEHPVGTGHDVASYLENPHCEDRVVNIAADIVCQTYWITDYIERLADAGASDCVPPSQLTDDHLARARSIAAQLLGVLQISEPKRIGAMEGR